jgi:chloramphenicol 3-O phosphotransferase
MAAGKLIILNGGSSAGKTSLAQALQGALDEVYLLLGIDLFWFSLPPKQLDLHCVEPEFYSWKVEREKDLDYFTIIPGPILDSAMYARYHAIAAYLDRGLNVIADDVIWKKEWLLDMLRVLKPFEVTFIGVHVSDGEGARREEARGNRFAGWNRGSARAAHANAEYCYDLQIDTTSDSPDACADKIKTAFDGGLRPRAFASLRERLGG